MRKAETEGKHKLAILGQLADTTWAANERMTVYEGAVRPHLENGFTASPTSTKTNLQALDSMQNQTLRLITGGNKDDSNNRHGKGHKHPALRRTSRHQDPTSGREVLMSRKKYP